MQLRSGELALTTGNFANESGVEENWVNSRPATVRRSMRPLNAGGLGNWKRQSPQICFAFNSQASSRSAAGTRSVENNSDTGWAPVLPDSDCSRLKDIVIPNRQEIGGALTQGPGACKENLAGVGHYGIRRNSALAPS